MFSRAEWGSDGGKNCQAVGSDKFGCLDKYSLNDNSKSSSGKTAYDYAEHGGSNHSSGAGHSNDVRNALGFSYKTNQLICTVGNLLSSTELLELTDWYKQCKIRETLEKLNPKNIKTLTEAVLHLQRIKVVVIDCTAIITENGEGLDPIMRRVCLDVIKNFTSLQAAALNRINELKKTSAPPPKVTSVAQKQPKTAPKKTPPPPSKTAPKAAPKQTTQPAQKMTPLPSSDLLSIITSVYLGQQLNAGPKKTPPPPSKTAPKVTSVAQKQLKTAPKKTPPPPSKTAPKAAPKQTTQPAQKMTPLPSSDLLSIITSVYLGQQLNAGPTPSIAKPRDCSLNGYKETYLKELNKHSQNPLMKDDISITALAALDTFKTMQLQCEGPVNCTPTGYYNFVVSEVKPVEKVINFVVKEFFGNSASAAGGCITMGAGGGIIGAVLTLPSFPVAGPAGPALGGALGFAVGCRTGMVVGPILYNGYKIAISVNEDVVKGINKHLEAVSKTPIPKDLKQAKSGAERIQEGKKLFNELASALSKHSKNCAAQQPIKKVGVPPNSTK